MYLLLKFPQHFLYTLNAVDLSKHYVMCTTNPIMLLIANASESCFILRAH